MIVSVLVGARYGPRDKIFDAVIDKVEVKRLAELSPREIEHDNPEIRRAEDMATFLGQLYNRRRDGGRHRHGDPVLARSARRLAAERGLRIRTPNCSGGRSSPPHSSHSTANADENARVARRAARSAARRAHCGHAAGSSASNSSK